MKITKRMITPLAIPLALSAIGMTALYSGGAIAAGSMTAGEIRVVADANEPVDAPKASPHVSTPARIQSIESSAIDISIVPVASAAAHASDHAVAQTQQVWTLNANELIQHQLQRWAQETRSTERPWTFEWKVDRGWIVPAGTSFTGTFDTALEQVIRNLYEQGKPLKLVIWEENNHAEVLHVDAK